MYTDNDLTIRPIKEKDLPKIWELVYKNEAPEWKIWDAPYYPHSSKTWDEFQGEIESWINRDERFAIILSGNLIGVVTYYWEHQPSKWLEMGIILYESKNWGNGIGTRALKIWINHLFSSLPLVRVGFTTWSGNKRMIRVGEKLNMKMEARIRKVRYYNEKYYDSIKMGMLKEEWEKLNT
jgi:RimJ/RimL family protein N-acetyltransferase